MYKGDLYTSPSLQKDMNCNVFFVTYNLLAPELLHETGLAICCILINSIRIIVLFSIQLFVKLVIDHQLKSCWIKAVLFKDKLRYAFIHNYVIVVYCCWYCVLISCHTHSSSVSLRLSATQLGMGSSLEDLVQCTCTILIPAAQLPE